MNIKGFFGKIKAMSMENSKWRTGFDMATVLAFIGFAFNAGIEYNKVDVISSSQRMLDAKVQRVVDNEEPLDERVARMEAILQDIRDELRQSNEAQRK